MRLTHLFPATLIVVGLLVASSGTAFGGSYYLYEEHNPGIGYTTGIAGYVDTAGVIEGMPGAEYLFVTGGPSYTGHHYAYTYRVDTAGDPALHPLNPDATGAIAPRTFTQVGNSHYIGYFSSGHENAFYVNDNGIYYGADDFGVRHWDFGWLNESVVAPVTPITTQTLAYDEATGNWWAGGTLRELYMYDGVSWVYQGTHPNLVGNHHDGMEIVNGKLFISDMTSDVIIMYDLDGSIDWNSPDETFNYTAGPAVEGMGFGPNQHFWISGWSSHTFYEIGGGELQKQVQGAVPLPSAAWMGLGLLGLVGAVRRLRRR